MGMSGEWDGGDRTDLVVLHKDESQNGEGEAQLTILLVPPKD